MAGALATKPWVNYSLSRLPHISLANVEYQSILRPSQRWATKLVAHLLREKRATTPGADSGYLPRDRDVRK
jgi:hypothetical protein